MRFRPFQVNFLFDTSDFFLFRRSLTFLGPIFFSHGFVVQSATKLN